MKTILLFRIVLIIFFISIVSPIYAVTEDLDLYIALGIQKINEGKMKDARESLEKALALSPENLEANYYAGIANSRLGNYRRAEGLFFKVLKTDENTAGAYLELGRLYFQTSRCTKAEDNLSRFISMSEDEASKAYAGRLIDNCSAESGEKPYYLNASLGMQYDTNVILEPSNPPIDADRKSDARGLLYISSGATLFEKGAIKLKADYSFYQSLHFNLNDYNVHYHRLTPYIEIDLSDKIKPSIGYSFDYTLFGGDRYSRFHSLYGKLKFLGSKNLSTEALYEYRDIKYWDSDIFEANSIRSGTQNSAGVKQNYNTDRFSCSVYYYGEYNRAEEDFWSYNGHKFGAEIAYRITSPLYIGVSGEYNRKKFRDDFSDTDERRSDKIQEYALSLTYLVSKRVSISLTENYTINNSNLSIFDYKRNITGISLTVGVL